MKRLALVAGVSFVGLVAVGGWFMLRDGKDVKVTVLNRSHQSIASVRLEHEDGIVGHGPIADRDSATIAFSPNGESSYRLYVRLADGSRLTGGAGYAEPGYRFNETVTPERIKSEMKGFGDY